MSLSPVDIMGCTMIALDQPPTWPPEDNDFCFTLEVVPRSGGLPLYFSLWTRIDFDGDIDWGDVIETNVSIRKQSGGTGYIHEYQTTGTYKVRMHGTFYTFGGHLYATPNYIISIDSKLPKPNYDNFANLFVGCSNLRKFPSNIFQNCQEVTNFESCFGGCSSLSSLPSNLFNPCINANRFDSCFSGCSSLTAIPSGLFDGCTSVTTFESCFSGCSSITSIPSGLFNDCSRVTNFSSCFSVCRKLESVPLHLFDDCPNVSSFNYCFYECSSIVSYVPELWVTFSTVSNHTLCYRYCYNAANYADIPASWR